MGTLSFDHIGTIKILSLENSTEIGLVGAGFESQRHHNATAVARIYCI